MIMMEVKLSYRIDMSEHSQWKIVTVQPFSRAELLYVQELGDFDSGPEYYTTREGLDSYLIKITLSGKGLLTYQGRQCSVCPGQFFWIDCRQPQDYRTDPETGRWHVIWVHFRGANVAAYYQMFLSANGGNPVGTLAPGSDTVALLKKLLILYDGHTTFADDISASALLTQLLAQCTRAAAVQPAANVLPPAVLKVQEYILEHYEERITLNLLAKRFFISKYHLQRLFKKYAGQSPNEYLSSLRVNHAKELLRATDLPVSVIAERVGMENVSYFISVFHKQENVTPQKYRASWPDT